MSEITKQLAQSLKQLQQLSDQRYNELQTQLGQIAEQVIAISDNISKQGNAETKMTEAENGITPCKSCKHAHFYKNEGAAAPKFQCLLSGIERTVAACNKVE